ncbi:Trifunctional nucleotide phosphoesterase protein YfkN [Hypsizygus marmoreus]|uniref:Trifunctional nucleotide phosphoesterase protein YfkN n=1 Tax=Hypsizygus marmoreus TaxID=39966 RepID=A0A369JNQ3_HYPMA|nr:Trifunctional nucleotide phosphoesterase protein YfkN [Hypsizygus marmoreus]
MSKLSILHFNDVYRISPQKLSPNSEETIDVAQFGALIDDIRQKWTDLPDGKKDGLLLFSGDLFSPSVESSVTRGSHMVPVMNELALDVALTGNHDFDFGYPHLSKLIQDTNFPWLLSNIIDSKTSEVPAHLHEFQILERGGVRVGIIGLVEREWITTVSTWPSEFIYKDMEEVGSDLSKRLRDPQGEYRCDLIIALTHSRLPNDIALAKSLHALSPSAQDASPIHWTHGVDLILGGHDHFYYVSKGVSFWEDFDVTEEVLGAEEDLGDVLVIKSGTDFRELSELNLEFRDAPPGSIRHKVITRITGKRHTTKSDSRSSESLRKLLETLLSSVSSTLKAPVCKTTTVIDVRSQIIRTAESAAGNWFADIVRHAYDDALCMKGCGGSDGVFICAGTLRGDSTYGPGVVTLGNILEILPFEDPLVVLELDGASIWDALESSLSTWPAQEGRFPVVSGLRVSWDSRREPGSRVLGVWLVQERETSEDGSEHASGASTPKFVDGEPILENGSRKYKIVTRQYMAEGHDGFLALEGKPYLITDESGQLMSLIVRKYLLGSQFVNKMASLAGHVLSGDLHLSTQAAISREQVRRRIRQKIVEPKVVQHWKRAATFARRWARSRLHYQDKLNVCTTEHMSSVDAYDGESARRGKAIVPIVYAFNDEDLLVVNPEIDGRLKDDGRAD